MDEPQAPLYHLLYTSNLAPGVSVGNIAGIARASRQRNAQRNISGTLVFDGLRFCHYLEGPQNSVRELAKRIAADPRHVDFKIRHEGPYGGPRRFAAWSLGYSLAQHADALDALDAAWGDEAIASLLRILPSCEPEP